MKQANAITTEPLTLIEKSDLKNLVKQVTKGEQSFIEVAMALVEIRARRLWREEADSFEEFCRKNWGWGASRARQICLASKCFHEQSEAAAAGQDVEIPKTENEARRIMKDKRAKKSVTYVTPEDEEDEEKDFADRPHIVAHTEVMPPEPATPAAANEPVGKFLDETGYPIPRKLLPMWERNREVDELIKPLLALRQRIATAGEQRDRMFSEFNYNRGEEYLTNLMALLKSCRGHAVCPQCSGHPEVQLNNHCSLCWGKGLVSEYKWKMVPEETRAIREKIAKSRITGKKG